VFDEIDGFLENVTGHIMGCIQQVMQDASAVNGVVRNMRRLLPGRVVRSDLEDMTRLFGEVDTFKTNARQKEDDIRCVDMLSQMMVAMTGFWFVDHQCVWFELGNTLTNLQRACICIAIFSIAVRLAQSAVRRRRTIRAAIGPPPRWDL
ncbi:hypothetical protein JX266_014478, partial [Neoarthrinium moseri]